MFCDVSLVHFYLLWLQYQYGEEVILWVNKVGPFRNPQETYLYYKLPWCAPDKVEETPREGLGEALQGYELRKSGMHFEFQSMSSQHAFAIRFSHVKQRI